MKKLKILVTCFLVFSLMISISAFATASELKDFGDAFLTANQSKWIAGNNVEGFDGSISNISWEGNELVVQMTQYGSLTYDVAATNDFDIEFMMKYDEGSTNDTWGLGLQMIYRGTHNPGLDDTFVMWFLDAGFAFDAYGPGWYSKYDGTAFWVDPETLTYDRTEWNKYRITVKTNSADNEMVDLSVTVNDVFLGEGTIEANPTDSGKLQFYIPQPGANANFRLKAVPSAEPTQGTTATPTETPTQEEPGDFNSVYAYLMLAVAGFATIVLTRKKVLSN